MVIFLNCTKNTELTPRPFARTFSFALSIKNFPNSGRDDYGRRRTRVPCRQQPFPFTVAIKIWSTLMKATHPWITYRTRFLVKAKQLTASLTFTDSLGRPHSGRKGDYLVESSDGVLRIAPRQIFEDIYVRLVNADTSPSLPLQPHLTRKSPQPERRRRNSVPGLRSL